MRCFYSKNLNKKYPSIDPSEKKHIFSVLRFKKKDKFFLIDGNGSLATAWINLEEDIEILKVETYTAPEIKIELFVSPPKAQNMDKILAQCTEVGVWGINPIFTDNSVSIPKKNNVLDKWKKKVLESCKQSHNPFCPHISPLRSFEEAVENAKDDYQCFYAHQNGQFLVNKKLSLNKQNSKKIALFVGPEGGFSDSEIERMESANFEPIKFGEWIMRVETASVVGISLLKNLINPD